MSKVTDMSVATLDSVLSLVESLKAVSEISLGLIILSFFSVPQKLAEHRIQREQLEKAREDLLKEKNRFDRLV
jgi:hypothetical protein